MRGLAFPPNAPIDREASYEYGTPISNVDDIPIDPALGEAAIDPALMMEEGSTNVAQPQLENHYPQHQQPPLDDYQVRQYSQGPQGDPFAPQIPVAYFPIEQEQPPPPKPKRKRKVYREEECSFCQGNETKNKHNEPEPLITCHECGRSGHPSCMELERLAGVVRSYPWKCIECKNCEVCQEKGDDDRILFCDWCDRGWHMDCVVPPLQEPPDGEWHCPVCPPVIPEGQIPYLLPEESRQSPMVSAREPSQASTSRSAVEAPATAIKSRGRKKGTGKGRARGTPKITVAIEDSDNDSPGMVEETPTVFSRGRGRPPKSNSKTKARAPTISSDEERAISPVRPPKRRRPPPREPSPPPPPLPRVRLRLPAQRGKGKEREEEEFPHGLFDDILGIEERDTTKTTITNTDKLYFERSRLAAEEKLAPPPPPPPTASSSRTVDTTEDLSGRSRPLRSATLQHIQTPVPKRIDFSNSPGPSTPGGSLPKFEPGVLRIRTIRFGPYDIKTWYDAPFPEEYANIPDGRLWICEFCLKYMKSRFGAIRHQMKCKARHPPGDEIYRDGAVSIFEVDGRRNKIYCQNLCLLSKMFLDHKSLFYDVEPFLFYVITQVDDFGARFVGYFSKEKRCPKDYNLSCIMTLPVRQRQGWGNLLIDFSYLLSKIEQRLGSPEKPLSSLGALGYKSYWTLAVMRFLQTAPDNVRLEDISSATSMTHEDVCNTLIQQNMIFIRESTPPPIRPSPGQAIKYPKGRKNGIARKQLQRMQTQDKDADGNKSPFVIPKHYEIHFDRQKVEAYVRNWESKGYLKLKPEKLQWTPYIVTRTSQEAMITVDQPAMDTLLDESIKTPITTTGQSTGQSTQPTTPPPPLNGATADSPAPVEEAEKDELPMLVDIASPEPRTRARSSLRSPVKEKEHSRSLKATRPASPPPTSTPLALPARSLRTRSSNANIPSPSLPAPEESASVRTTRRGTTRRSSRRVEEDNNDEALAAKLAMEEQMQSRQLRSRRSESQMENKKPVALVTIPPKATPSRKRRRIESSPEVDESPPPEALSVEVVRGDAMDVDSESRRINGNHNGHLDPFVETQTPENTDATTLVDVNNTSATEEEIVAREILNKQELDVKSEDAGTPLTSLTSRQSLPSDDTVFMADMGHVSAQPANKFADYHGAIHAESDLRSTLAPPEKSAVMNHVMDLDECHDEDADGEYEEDAEGEPDLGEYC